jgi:hypothetical protein
MIWAYIGCLLYLIIGYYFAIMDTGESDRKLTTLPMGFRFIIRFIIMLLWLPVIIVYTAIRMFKKLSR